MRHLIRNETYKLIQSIIKIPIEGFRSRDRREIYWLRNIQDATGYKDETNTIKFCYAFTFLNLNSIIANQVKTNMRVTLLKHSLLLALILCHCSHLTDTTIIITITIHSLFLSAYNLYANMCFLLHDYLLFGLQPFCKR